MIITTLKTKDGAKELKNQAKFAECSVVSETSYFYYG